MTADPAPIGVLPRLVAWRVLEAVGDGAYADLALEREFKRQPLPALDRAMATEISYGAIRMRRRLDCWIDRFGKVPALRQPPRLRWLLHVGLQQLLAMDRVPASAAVSTAVDLAKRERLASLAPVVNGVLRSAARAIAAGEQLPLPENPQARLALEQSWPDWLVNELWSSIGAERTQNLAAASNITPALDLRVNPLRSTVEEVLAAFAQVGVLAAALPNQACGLTFLQRPGPLTQLPGYKEGHWCVQDRAAQTIAPLLDPQPGQRVLDACAAPGGKTTHLAELMGDKGELIALDRSASRLERVRENALRLGHTCIRTAVADAVALDELEKQGQLFDRVLLDVPCSGLGTLARHADARWGLKAEMLPELVELQRQLLEQGARLLAPGGRLVYATCTLNPSENQQQVQRFLQGYPNWQLLEPENTFWPSAELGGDGFYGALLGNSGGGGSTTGAGGGGTGGAVVGAGAT
ncbi:16S rRNA (cytosine(967)-C(5))-methyltransferase [Synechococcus sp.]